ncbi:MAG: hypothetical protein GY699_17545 [Desulfobacteraceae bacterium]|nr:hypothetical protein [Desulfobacteraceae bacterium]
MVIKLKYYIIFSTLFFLSIIQVSMADTPCSCDQQNSIQTIIGVELVTCSTNASNNQRVNYTEHTQIHCSGNGLYINTRGSNNWFDFTPNEAANRYKGSTYRVFRNGTHVLAIHKNFTGQIGGVNVTDYSFGVVHNNVITCPYIFPPLNVTSDRDGDGIVDCIDNCPDDPNKTEPEDCGCGNLETDSDKDGVADCVDNCPNIPNPDQGPCPPPDSDGDSVPDIIEENSNDKNLGPGC